MHNIIKAITDKPVRLAAGLMSGTSMDGVDVAFTEITGSGADTKAVLKGFLFIPYTDARRADLLMNSSKETSSVADICRLNKELGVLFGEAVVQAAEACGIDMADIDFISSHGQTMFHMPEHGATLQIGELADIAAITGKPVVGDFRPSDMAYGGQGAPLVPYVDYLLYRDASVNRILFNIGGIGNITVLPACCSPEDVLAFDTGPGNVIIDNMMRLHTKGEEQYDYRGSMAQTGNQNLLLAEHLADIDFCITQKPPKSTGREHYTVAFAERILRRGAEMGLSFPDILATTTNHTAYALWYAVTNFITTPVDEITVTGGGVKNAYLMRCLEELFPGRIRVITDTDSDAKEALAFAVLGNEFLFGNGNNMLGATGASRSVVMGKLAIPS